VPKKSFHSRFTKTRAGEWIFPRDEPLREVQAGKAATIHLRLRKGRRDLRLDDLAVLILPIAAGEHPHGARRRERLCDETLRDLLIDRVVLLLRLGQVSAEAGELRRDGAEVLRKCGLLLCRALRRLDCKDRGDLLWQVLRRGGLHRLRGAGYGEAEFPQRVIFP
jgi:hypothetical protein